MERFITASLEIDNEDIKNISFEQSMFHSVVSEKVRATDYRPNLKVVSIDIETSSDGPFAQLQLYSIAIYSEQYSRVFMVDENLTSNKQERVGDGATLYRYTSAKVCLHCFLRWFQECDPDVVIGWHVVQFDLWVLEKISQNLKVPFLFGRGRQKLNWREDSNDAGSSKVKYYAHVPGRIILDGIELLRTAFYHFDSFSLQNVAQEVLGDSKLLEHDNRGEAITELFKRDKMALAAYNLHDCKLVWDIFEKTKLLSFALERSRLTGLAMDRMGGSVASFDYAYLPRLHRQGYVAPNLGELESDILSPGGYVMRSTPGLYRDILVLDFKSLYPSIIRTFAIDPYAFWSAEHQKMSKGMTIPGFNGAYFSREKAILPKLISELWQAREQAKSDNNKPLSQAIKIIMNSFYGVLGSTGCRFFDPRVCSSITLRGHEIIQSSRDWVIAQGYDVIYGDTDSLFIWLGNKPSGQHPQEVGAQLALGLNYWWAYKLDDELNIKSSLEVEFETHYTHFLMPTIRGSTEGTKKRYAGIVEIDDSKHESANDERSRPKKLKKEKLVFKGLETVRNDWTELAKEFQQVLYYKVFKEEPYVEHISHTVRDLFSGDLDDQLVYKKKLRRALVGYEKSTPPHVKAARKLYKLTGKKLGRGDTICYVLTVNGPEPLECQQSQIDYQHYVDKQLKPIADSILVFIGDRFEKIIGQQLELI
jgi:DNA polymerase-2